MFWVWGFKTSHMMNTTDNYIIASHVFVFCFLLKHIIIVYCFFSDVDELVMRYQCNSYFVYYAKMTIVCSYCIHITL